MVKTKIIYLLILILLVPLVSCSKKKTTQIPPYVVNVIKVQDHDWQKTILATGTLSSFYGIMVKAETSGRVTSIFLKSGKYVEQGTPLVQIYPDILKAQLQKAEARLKLSQIDYLRYLDLYKTGFYAKSDLDKAHTEVKNNQGEVDQIKAQLVQTHIVAPFSGKLGLRLISLGDYLSPGKEIIQLESIDPIRVDFSVPEIYLGQIELGDKVAMTTRAYPKTTFTGKIYAFNSIVNQGTRSLDVWATIPNKDHKLMPGVFVEVTIYLGKKQSVMMVPQTAIVYTLDGDYVYRFIDHKAVKTKVTIGPKIKDNWVIVNSGIKEGDEVISDGQVKLTDGAPVMTREEAQQMFNAQAANQQANKDKKQVKQQDNQQKNKLATKQGNKK